MNPYKKGIKLEDHSLEQVFRTLGVSKETEFVDKFFGQDEIQTILESCGLSVDTPIERTLEHKVRIGQFTVKRADLTFTSEDQLYYFEVMSQSGGGRWDDEHHMQIMIKRTRLGLEYGAENVHTFAIAFNEFDTSYLSEIQLMENAYAIHLRFNDNGYYADVYGVEDKKRAIKVKLATLYELGNKLIKIAKEVGLPMRREEVLYERYVYIGKGYNNTRLGIEWVMYGKNDNQLAIKIHSDLIRYANSKGKNDIKIIDDTNDLVTFMSSKIPDVTFLPIKGTLDNTGCKFNFDCNNPDGELLVTITRAFAEYFNLSDLLT
jgi:hypothetical protein